MTKITPIPRLSIVVPVARDLAAFESTLVSVLENRPSQSEILVCHDGGYDDPFDLSDEVRFIVGNGNSLIDLVTAGAAAAHGRFVHVLASGFRATPDWTDQATGKFEHFDAGVVAPVIRHSSGNRIVAAGWHDAGDRLCKPSSAGRTDVAASTIRLAGSYLEASFWRRDLLHSLCAAFDGQSPLEQSYAMEHLSRRAGWRCVVASESDVLFDDDVLPCDRPCVDRGKRLRAVRSHFYTGGWSVSIQAAARAAMGSLFRPGQWGECIGQALAPTIEAAATRRIRASQVVRCDEGATIHQMPRRQESQVRRAA